MDLPLLEFAICAVLTSIFGDFAEADCGRLNLLTTLVPRINKLLHLHTNCLTALK
jgi:hypothetical protein